jgi:CO dehydrogenase/acetyl-CoA synthase gamma subunit (corrinoid Fe-S protein)|tara:strand:+ start:298 stop:462 length:165 start_codon:yes stop_codon:yes gene_type:complete
MITLEQIKNIAKDIKEDKEWVNDSHTFAQHKGVVDGLDRLIRHIEEIIHTNKIY